MDIRFSRNMPALSESECEALRSKTVCVVGCGGLGGHIIELLTRIGVGTIRVIDGDVFDLSNLNRQLLCKADMIGSSKAAAAKDRILSINPEANVEAFCEYMTEVNAFSLVSGCDAVFDALDSAASRKMLEAACEKAGIPYIYGAISGWVAQAALSLPGDRITQKLYPTDDEPRGKSVLSFTPALCASLQVSLGVKHLVGRDAEHSTLYCFDTLDNEFAEIRL